MILLYILLLVIVLLVFLMFAIESKIKFLFDTEETFMNLWLFWLDPFIKVVVTIENSITVLKVHLFNKLVFTKKLNKEISRIRKIDLLKIADPKNIDVDINYGFRDPFATGITFGVLSGAYGFLNIDSINQTPDFLTSKDYIRVDANANVNIGSALINFLRFGHNK